MRSATGNITDSTSLFAIYIAVKCVQHLLIITVVIQYFCVVITLWRRQVYHTNLIVLLTALPVCSVLAVCTSTAMDLFGLLNLLVNPLVDVIEFVSKTGMSGGALNLPNFIIERVVATVFVDKYENCNNNFPIFSSAMVSSQICITVFLIYLNTIGVISDFCGVICFGIICVVSALIFCILPIISRRAYNLHRRRGSKITVRYQTAENLRAARLLNKLMVLYPCFFITENVFYLFTMFIIEYDDLIVQETLLGFLDIIIAMEISASVTIMAYSHPSLKKDMCLWKYRKAAITPEAMFSPTVTSTCRPAEFRVRAIDGRQLLFDLDQEKEIYFKSYADMWNK